MDEGPSNLAMLFWAMYSAKLRCIYLKDPYHRCWNDIKLGLGEANVFWMVRLTRIVFNAAYGPYDGKAWWNQLQDCVRDAIQ